jgi:hypothetical protein
MILSRQSRRMLEEVRFAAKKQQICSRKVWKDQELHTTGMKDVVVVMRVENSRS